MTSTDVLGEGVLSLFLLDYQSLGGVVGGPLDELLEEHLSSVIDVGSPRLSDTPAEQRVVLVRSGLAGSPHQGVRGDSLLQLDLAFFKFGLDWGHSFLKFGFNFWSLGGPLYRVG